MDRKSFLRTALSVLTLGVAVKATATEYYPRPEQTVAAFKEDPVDSTRWRDQNTPISDWHVCSVQRGVPSVNRCASDLTLEKLREARERIRRHMVSVPKGPEPVNRLPLKVRVRAFLARNGIGV